MVIKFSLPLNHLDENFIDLILQKPSFVLNVMAIFSRFSSGLWILIYGSATNHKTIKLNSINYFVLYSTL